MATNPITPASSRWSDHDGGLFDVALPDDPPGDETVCGLGNRKNLLFNVILERDGIAPSAGSRATLDLLDNGATFVVDDLAGLLPDRPPPPGTA